MYGMSRLASFKPPILSLKFVDNFEQSFVDCYLNNAEMRMLETDND